jgi:hypothetical protein
MTDLRLRRKLSFRAHGRTLVLVKRSNEKIAHEPSASVHACL